MIGKILCFFGRHKWTPITEPEPLYISKWEQYEICLGKCDRCGYEHEIRKEVW